jgi:hypothetical protein
MSIIVILLQKIKSNHKLPKLSKGILIIISPFDKKGDIDLGISFIKNILLLNGNYIPNQLIFFLKHPFSQKKIIFVKKAI